MRHHLRLQVGGETRVRQGGDLGVQERAAAADGLNARLLADRELFLPGDLLPKVDRMSMANALEVRSPLLDHRLVEFAGLDFRNGLPGNHCRRRPTTDTIETFGKATLERTDDRSQQD